MFAVLPAAAEAQGTTTTKDTQVAGQNAGAAVPSSDVTRVGDDRSSADASEGAVRLVVRPGDSLWSISHQRLRPKATARQILDDVERIYAANRNLIGEDPNQILVGQELLLPPVRHRAAERTDEPVAPQPAPQPVRKQAIKQRPEPTSRALPELAPAPIPELAPGLVPTESPVAVFIPEVYERVHLLLGVGILLLTLGIGCLMAWKLPMKRNTREASTNGRARDRVRVMRPELYRLLFETGSEGMLVATTGGTVLEVNRAGCNLLRRTQEEILGLGLDIFDASDPRLEAALSDLYETGRFVGRMRLSRGGTHPSPAEASVTGWRVGGTKLIGITFRDLVDHRRESAMSQLPEHKRHGAHQGSFPSMADGRAVSADSTTNWGVDGTLHRGEEHQRKLLERSKEGIYIIDPEDKRIIESNLTLQAMFGYAANELRGMKIYNLVVQDPESVNSDLRQIVDERYRFVGEREYRRKDGSLLKVEILASPLRYGSRETICALVRDITERKRTEESLKSSLEKLLALREAGQLLGSTLKLEELNTRLLQIMQRIAGFSAAVISMPDERRQLHVWRAIGFANLWHKAHHTPEVQQALGTVLKTGEQLHIRLRPPVAERERLVALFLPLRVRDRVIGVLEVYLPELMVEIDTRVILQGLANQAANALDNAQLYEALVQREKRLHELVAKLFAAQEAERRRVAYEVHDSLGQLVVAAYQHLQAFARSYVPKSEQDREVLDQALELVRRTVGEARRVIAGLRPTTLDDFGLQTAIRLEVEDLRAEGWNIGYEEALDEDERLPAAVETALFRIAQEALTNVRKHAGTRRVRISLKRLGRNISLSVRDWGRGFDAASTPLGGDPSESVGLSSMKERTALLGGEFKIRSRPGVGTVVNVKVPLPTSGEPVGRHMHRTALRGRPS
jgi:PAS domain S-box-containing protein